MSHDYNKDFYKQYAQVLDFNEIKSILDVPQCIQIFHDQKSSAKLWMKYFELEINLSIDDIKKMWDWNGDYNSEKAKNIQYRIADIKSEQMVDAINKLMKNVEFWYKTIATSQNLELNSDNFIEIIEDDFSWIDLYPGDTQIYFKVFTRRGLLKK